MNSLKEKMIKKSAEVKSALVSKEAANNTTEVVVIILGVVVIATAVIFALKKVIGDDTNGILGTVNEKLTEWAGKITGPAA